MPARTKGIRAGRAFVELFADDSKLVRGQMDLTEGWHVLPKGDD